MIFKAEKHVLHHAVQLGKKTCPKSHMEDQAFFVGLINLSILFFF